MAASEQDGALYEGVLQCRFVGRAFADGAWAQGVGVQAFPHGQLLSGCLSRKGRKERRARRGWCTPGNVNVPGMDSAVYVVNGSRTSCNACRCALRGHLQKLASAREGQGAGGGTAHGAAGVGAAGAGAGALRIGLANAWWSQVRDRAEEDPARLEAAHNLAASLSSQGKHAEAEKMEREVLAVEKRVLGAGHPDTLTTAGNLASSLSGQGKYAEAEEMEREVLAVEKRVLGRSIPTR